MQTAVVDWKRLRKSLEQECRSLGGTVDVGGVMKTIERILLLCGEASANRKMLYRIGRLLLNNSNGGTIIAPACPDYSHKDGRYNFKSLSGGVSLLASKHILFLDSLVAILPAIKILILLADHEADDADLRRVVGKTRDEFLELIRQSEVETRQQVRTRGWEVGLMTAFIPDLVDEEKRIAKWIGETERFKCRIDTETTTRSDMYYKINRNFTAEEEWQRTVQTSAQYMALGNFAAKKGFFVCNHTTTNLSWYLQTEVALLHNPISVY